MSSEILADSGDEQQPEPNPFDPESLYVAQDYEAGAPVEEVITTIAVRRPGKQEWVRVRGDDWRAEVCLIEEEDSGDHYCVTPKMAPYLADEYRRAYLYLAVNSKGSIFLWRAWTPTDGPGRSWHTSMIRVVEQAKNGFVRVRSDKANSGYQYSKSKVAHPDPTWPDNYTMADYLRIAFEDKLVDSPDHPLLKSLMGQ